MCVLYLYFNYLSDNVSTDQSGGSYPKFEKGMFIRAPHIKSKRPNKYPGETVGRLLESE